ncbi:uncharacterized protein LOC133886369 [Phragmites australis]|uniref:uncharacterized protein LOC133886369 n=1 Tax=Phragmites australis TaxID=29695 RepID=UPI002D767710|nr:uncharacterized protein LOC133886369 [Phragmites australis]
MVHHIFRGVTTYSSNRRPGRYPIVVDPTVQSIRLGYVLVNGGSSINLLFADTLDALHILRNVLKPSPPLFGITPGSSANPLGQIELLVTFGSPSNFRTERILFDVADFGTAYNAILGLLTMVQFMVVAHYTYQAIKKSGSTGAITAFGNAKMALHYDKRSLDMVELTPKLQPEDTGPSGRPMNVYVLSSPDDRLKAVCLDEADPSRMVQIVIGLDPK